MKISSSAWRNLKFSFAMLMAGGLLAACGGDKESASTNPANSAALCDVTTDTVLHAVPASSGGGGGPSNTLTVHYKRTNGDYTGWQVHGWNAIQDPGWNNGYNSTGTDSFGAIYKPTVANVGGAGYLMHKGDTKDLFGGTDANQSLTIAAGVNEIWRKEGDPVTYTTNPDGAVTPNLTKVKVHYLRYNNDYTQWGLHMWGDDGTSGGSGIKWADLPGAVQSLSWGDAANFADMPGYVAAGDGSEVSFEIPVVNPVDDSSKTKAVFIVHGDGGASGNSDNKDGWNNNIEASYSAMTITAQVGEIWLVQGKATVYYAKPDLRAVSTTDASAVWLNQQYIQWPNVNSAGTIKLYYSANGALAATTDGVVSGADGSITLEVASLSNVSAATQAKYAYVGTGVVLKVPDANLAQLKELHKSQVLIVQEDGSNKVQNATMLQIAGAMDDLYADAKNATNLGVKVTASQTDFGLWAPTAQKVTLCVYNTNTGAASDKLDMTFDPATGIWTASKAADLTGKYYKFAVEVFVRGVGVVRNMVTDPYSISLSANSKRSYIADLDSPTLKPTDWDATARPVMPDPSSISVYQTHVRDFSIADSTIPAAERGKFVAFANPDSAGMAHLQLLANAGLTHVQFLPVYDGGSVDELNCVTPTIAPVTDGAASEPTATIAAQADTDCYNWGFDPVHYGSIDGTYSTDPSDGAVRVKEFRSAVLALHKKGLGVITDMVYNHTFQTGQGEKSILDRVVPGYYHRLSENGSVISGFGVGLPNTASENAMFEKLMIDTAVRFAVDYKIDSFRFDWMSDHSVGTMKRLRAAVSAAITAKEGAGVKAENFYVFGEGWGSGASVRFGGDPDGDKEAGQRFIAGTGLGVFNDRIRDGMRGVSYNAEGDGMLKQQGWVNGRWYDVNEANAGETLASQKTELLNRLNMMRSGMTGAVVDFMYPHTDSNGVGSIVDGSTLQSGYHAFTTNPQESVNYVAVHDNRTLYDYNTLTLPLTTSMSDRVRVQNLALGTIALSQGMAFFTQGSDILVSKDFDNDSYNSGDWFNQIFWDYSQNNFGIGLPNEAKNSSSYAAITPLLRNAALKPTPADIVKSRDLFIEMLKLRYASPLMRLKTGADVKARLKFYNADNENGFDPTFVMYRLDDTCNGCADLDPAVSSIVVVINADKVAKTYTNADFSGKTYALSNKHLDTVVTGNATYNAGTFSVPARSVAVFVEPE